MLRSDENHASIRIPVASKGSPRGLRGYPIATIVFYDPDDEGAILAIDTIFVSII